jgi:Na+/H+-dicarboxylate symporter
MLAAIVLGVFFSYKKNTYIENFIQKLKTYIELIFNKIFIPFLPLYVLGFLLKLSYENTFYLLVKSYGPTFLLIFFSQIIYLMIMYFAVSGFNFKKALLAFKNAVPSYLTAFGTMSSTAAIPVTIKSAEKNTNNSPLAHLGIPIMANVHLVGDAFSTPILSLVTMNIFLGHMPGLNLYLLFVFYFCIAMLATSGVPGGGIIVVIPLLKSIFGFTPEMIGVIMALYLLQDSFGTASNVMGDGALTIFVHKMLKKFGMV